MLGGLIVLVMLPLGFVLLRPIQVMPRLGPAPAFRLTDQLGRPVTHLDLVGQIVVFDFIATQGDEAAPVMTDSMRRLRDELRRRGWLGKRVRLVTLTFDPERDTPEVLNVYARAQQADPNEWLFLTGEPDMLRAVIGGGFGVYYRKSQTTGQGTIFSRTSKFVLVDGQGLIRAEYYGPTLDIARVIRDIELIQREASSTGVARYAYEAAHWFLCYPR